MPWTLGFELNEKRCVDYVCYVWVFVGWEAGVYEYGEVDGLLLCMSITGCSWVLKRVYISMKVFKLRT